MPQPSPTADGREMHLLLVAIAVSVGMLLLLGRFWFPDKTRRQTVEPAPPALEQLAANATHDELASITGNVERPIRPTVLSLAVQGTSSVRYLPAAWPTEDRAVVILPSDRRLADVEGTTPRWPEPVRDRAHRVLALEKQ